MNTKYDCPFVRELRYSRGGDYDYIDDAEDPQTEWRSYVEFMNNRYIELSLLIIEVNEN